VVCKWAFSLSALLKKDAAQFGYANQPIKIGSQ